MGESIGPVPEIRETLALANREFRAFVEREIKRRELQQSLEYTLRARRG